MLIHEIIQENAGDAERSNVEVVTCNGCQAHGRECSHYSWRFCPTNKIAQDSHRRPLPQSTHPWNSPNVSSYRHASCCRLRYSYWWDLSMWAALRCKSHEPTVRLSLSGEPHSAETQQGRAMARLQPKLSPWPRHFNPIPDPSPTILAFFPAIQFPFTCNESSAARAKLARMFSSDYTFFQFYLHGHGNGAKPTHSNKCTLLLTKS